MAKRSRNPPVKRHATFPKIKRDWILGTILVLAVFITYSAVAQAGFIWDDDVYITANPCMNGLAGLKTIWTTSAADISPLTFTTFWVEHALWGVDPLPYHLVNVLLHAACAILLWQVLRGLKIPCAWLGAALWALHPVQVESVAWITEAKNTQSGLFYLLTILFFVRWLREKGPEEKWGMDWKYALTLLCAALAMASKSSTVVLPVVLCLCAWWVERRWSWRNLAGLAPIFFMSILASALAVWTQSLHLAQALDPQWARTGPERLAGAGDAVWFYLGKLLWPHPLITIYPRWPIDPGQGIAYVPVLAVILVLFVLWLKRETWSRACFFVFAYFVVALLPVLGIFDNPLFHYSLVFDHFQYLAGMGPLALVGAGLVSVANFVIPGKPWLQGVLSAGLLLALATLSWQRTLVYESQVTLWNDTLAKNPSSWAACNNLGVVLFHEGQTDAAMAYYQRALAIRPNDAEAHNNLGEALVQKGQMDDAMVQFQMALANNPDDLEAHNNLGNAFVQKSRVDEAIGQYQKALAINPNNAGIYYNLGNAFLQKADVDEAIVQYQKALEIDPAIAKAHLNLGNAFMQKRSLDDAIAQYQKALEMEPNNAGVRYNLGMALTQKGELTDALVQFQEALRLKPDYTDAAQKLAALQATLQQRANPAK